MTTVLIPLKSGLSPDEETGQTGCVDVVLIPLKSGLSPDKAWKTVIA